MAMAEALSEVFTEVVVAPAYEADALVHLQARQNLRILEADEPTWPELDVRGIDGGLLVQTADRLIAEPATWQVVTDREPTASEWSDLEFAWRVAARVNSNTITGVPCWPSRRARRGLRWLRRARGQTVLLRHARGSGRRS